MTSTPPPVRLLALFIPVFVQSCRVAALPEPATSGSSANSVTASRPRGASACASAAAPQHTPSAEPSDLLASL
jgi:hypothetical protein